MPDTTMSNPTPGHIAYAAYWRILGISAGEPPWALQSFTQRRAWEAAAQAAIAAWWQAHEAVICDEEAADEPRGG